MSWDFRMYTTAGSEEKIYTDLDLSYTYNVSPMFRKALVGWTDGIKTIDNMTGEFAEVGLDIGFLMMVSDPDKFKAMNPDNGWGDYHGALEVLKTLLEYARKYPTAIFEVS